MNRIDSISTILIAFFILFQLPAVAQNTSTFVIGTTHTIQSKVLNEQRTYFLELPESYETSLKEYPILVLLNGGCLTILIPEF